MVHRFQLTTGLIVALSAYAAIGIAQAPAPAPQFGVVPMGSYESYKVDAVNMDNGNNIIKIPLFSLPQRGKLSLSFSAVANSPMWVPEQTCSPDDSTCSYWYDVMTASYEGGVYGDFWSGGGGLNGVIGGTIGPAIVPDTLPAFIWEQYNNPNSILNCGDCTGTTNGYATLWSVVDGTGGSHPLYYDSTNLTQLRTTDGSGFLFLSGMSNPSGYTNPIGGGGGTITSGPVLIDSRGIKYSFPEINASGSETVSDPDGNTITVSNSGITDSVNRSIPTFPQTTTSTAGCPVLSPPNPDLPPYQPDVGSSIWYVPGPNNSSMAYRICYSSFVVRTDFFGCPNYERGCSSTYEDSQGNNYEMNMSDTFATYQGIQSIVLPDGTYWGFLYDGGNPNNSTDVGHYGTISQMILPQGGSISYDYNFGFPPIPSCSPTMSNGVALTTLALDSRTVSDGNGNTYPWIYSLAGDYYPKDDFGRTYSTDPNGNDTLYTGVGEGCPTDLELSRTMYQGSYTTGPALRKVVTNYALTYAPSEYANAPDASGNVSYGNALEQSVTTTLNSTDSTTTTNGFAGSFSGTIPTYYCPSTCELIVPASAGAVTLSLSVPDSTSISDYTGTALSTTTTSYLWQSNSSYYNPANLLDTPTTVTTYNGASTQVAQSTTTYDEAAYSTGAIAGLPTSVSRWNNIGSAAITHTGYTGSGMVAYTVDALNHTSAQYTYGSTPCSSAYSSTNFVGLFPTSVANALGQTTNFTWDCNLGKPASSTDPNAVTTDYVYSDPLGRLTTLQNAVGTSAESWTTFVFPGFGIAEYPPPINQEMREYQDQVTKNDRNIKWSAVVDGLGRTIHQYPPNGSEIDTTYDGLDQVTSTSNPYYPGATYGTTSYTYDALGRKTIQHQPDGTSILQWCYDGIATTNQSNCLSRTGSQQQEWVEFADENQNDWQRQTDALGRLTRVVEPGGLQTNYGYDALGNLWSVNQVGNGGSDVARNRTFTYSSLSRLLCASNPENSAAACPTTASASYVSGTTGYTYDANGNVWSKTDARSVTTSFLYDWLNRVLSKSYSNDAEETPFSCYQYGTSAGFYGRLVSEWTQPAVSGACPTSAPTTGYLALKSIVSYDPMGRILSQQQQQCANGKCSGNAPYSLGMTYDLAGDPTVLTNSVGASNQPLTLTNYFDSAARPCLTTSSWTGNFPGNLFLANQSPSTPGYAAFGGLLNWYMGSSSSTASTSCASAAASPVNITQGYTNRLWVNSVSATGQIP